MKEEDTTHAEMTSSQAPYYASAPPPTSSQAPYYGSAPPPYSTYVQPPMAMVPPPAAAPVIVPSTTVIPMVINQAPSAPVQVIPPPGVCTVCRKGKIKSSPSWCTWICCLLLLPFGILPGLIIYCCCCREPKCTNCGYTC